MEFNEHWRNKYTSLKAAFRSTDPSKHFHGNPQKEFKPTTDYPEVSEPQLISKSVDDNIPVKPKKFKEKLLSSYNENATSTRQFARGQTAKYSELGVHLYGKTTNRKIKQLDDKLARKEAEITGNDSQKYVDNISKTAINAQHTLNTLKPKVSDKTAAQFSKTNKKTTVSSTPVSAAQFSHQQKSSGENKLSGKLSNDYTKHHTFKGKLLTHYKNKTSRKY